MTAREDWLEHSKEPEHLSWLEWCEARDRLAYLDAQAVASIVERVALVRAARGERPSKRITNQHRGAIATQQERIMSKLQPHQQRVVAEKERIDGIREAVEVERHTVATEKDGLDRFIETSPTFLRLPQDERARMKQQRTLQAETIDASDAYTKALLLLSTVLFERIAAF